MDGVILIGTRTNTHNALVHEEMIHRAFIIKKLVQCHHFPQFYYPVLDQNMPGKIEAYAKQTKINKTKEIEKLVETSF